MKSEPLRFFRLALLVVVGFMMLGVAACDVEVSQRVGEAPVDIPEDVDEPGEPGEPEEEAFFNDAFRPQSNQMFNNVFRLLQEYHYNQPVDEVLWEGALSALLANVSDETLVAQIDAELDFEASDEDTFMLAFTAINEYYDTDYLESDFWLFARDGLIESLEDPYTNYLDAEDIAQGQAGMGEDFVGIGVGIEIYENQILIVRLFSGSPAERAGLLPGDLITHVDGVDYSESSYLLVLDAITGEEGTDVQVGVQRPGVSETIFFDMIRERIPTPSVEGELIDNGQETIAYIQINQFGTQTASIFGDYLDEFDAVGYDGLVVDVRNNGGGALNTLNSILRYFLIGDDDNPFFSIEYYDRSVELYHSSAANRIDVPTVVLVNEFSASASEVFASAMHQQGGYDVLGVTTFGKGSVQTTYFVPGTSGDALTLTIGLWFTPENENVNHVGFEPNISVEQNPYLVTPSLIVDASSYERGDEGEMVEILQRILNALGYGDTLEENGVFDEATEAALIAYQTAKNLDVTGVLDALTARELSSDIFDYRTDQANDAQFQAAIERVLNLIDEE